MDVVIMMDESGKGEVGDFGDHALYLAASRLANNLRAVSNAFNYLHTTAFGTREYLCASDQLRLVIDKFVFCGRTRTGKPLFSDLVVEKAVGNFRYEFGKIATRGIVKGRLERIAPYMAARVRARTDHGPSAASSSAPVAASSLSREDEAFCLSNVTLETLKFCERHAIWSLGVPLRGKDGAALSRGVFQTLEGVLLNPELLSIEALGAERFRAFVHANWLDPDRIPSTIPNATSRFAAVVPEAAVLHQKALWRQRALSSLSVTELSEEQPCSWMPAGVVKFLMTNEEMEEEIRLRRGAEGSMSGVEKKSKKALAEALIAERSKAGAIQLPAPVAGPSLRVLHEAACASSLLATPVFVKTIVTGYTLQLEGPFGPGYYHPSCLRGEREWFNAPALSAPAPLPPPRLRHYLMSS